MGLYPPPNSYGDTLLGNISLEECVQFGPFVRLLLLLSFTRLFFLLPYFSFCFCQRSAQSFVDSSHRHGLFWLMEPARVFNV